MSEGDGRRYRPAPCDDKTRPTASARSSTTCTPSRRSRSTTSTRTRCSSPSCCRRRPPTRRSTRSRRPLFAVRRHAGEDGGARSRPDPRASSARCGLAPTKAKNLWLAANQIVDAGGEVHRRLGRSSSRSPASGHKTASVVMSQAFGVPAFPVDTHIHRLAARWGLSDGTNVERTERDLKAAVPARDVEPPPPADHLLRPRVLPGAAPRPRPPARSARSRRRRSRLGQRPRSVQVNNHAGRRRRSWRECSRAVSGASSGGRFSRNEAMPSTISGDRDRAVEQPDVGRRQPVVEVALHRGARRRAR